MAQRITFDELYRRSTQYRLWSFTKDELQQRRRTINGKGSSKVDERLNETPDVVPSQIEKVTVEEEQTLIAFHSRRILMLAKYFNMPSQVRVSTVFLDIRHLFIGLKTNDNFRQLLFPFLENST